MSATVQAPGPVLVGVDGSTRTAHGAAAGLVRTALELERAQQQNSGHAGAGSATVVVGRRGSGGFRAMSLGRTARLLAHEDGPPTVIVPSGWDPATVEPSAPVVVDARRAADRAERELEDLLRPWRTAYPSVRVAALATDRHPVAALLDQASGSELLVVPRGATAGAVVEYAECPVVVV